MKLSLLFLLLSFSSFAQNLKTVYFDFDVSETIIPDFDIPKNDSNYRIVSITAHCDTSGSKVYNDQLAMERFNFVFLELQKRGYLFDPLMENNVYGEQSAIEASNYTAKDWRKVDIEFEQVKEPSRSANTQARNQVRQSAAPDTITVPQEIEKTTETLSKSAVKKFANEDSEEELEFDLTILFVNASTRILQESEPQLFELLEIMQKNPTLHATFHGHVCCQPHQIISEGRARTVAIFLRENGIPADRIDFMGHSNTQPKVWPEVTDEDRKSNRRVSVVFRKMEE